MQLIAEPGALARAIADQIPTQGNIGVAISGGGDSLALMLALHQITEARGQQLEAMTVDHGLRAEAAAEADYARRLCQSLSIPHATARWTGWNGDGNLQNAAREGRYRLIAEWAKRRDLTCVCIGHTLDDVAETFVMRLARESGADGLARMASDFMRNDVRFLRPMLSIPREELRQFLKQHKIDWVEDPSNDNEDFDRVRVRRALAVFKDLGISAENLAAVSENMSQVREVLKTQVQSIGKQIVEQDRGDLVIDRSGFLDLHFELRRRLLNDALSWISPVSYPLRRNVISDLNEAIEAQRTFSCNGCLIQSSAKEIRILREFNAVRELVEFAPAWDRWVLEGPWTMGLKVTALGEPALAGVENWRASGLSRQSLMASPAVWKGETLVAAPLAGVGEGWTVRIRAQDFHSFMTGSAYSH